MRGKGVIGEDLQKNNVCAKVAGSKDSDLNEFSVLEG